MPQRPRVEPLDRLVAKALRDALIDASPALAEDLSAVPGRRGQADAATGLAGLARSSG